MGEVQFSLKTLWCLHGKGVNVACKISEEVYNSECISCSPWLTSGESC